ncbi:hypothetical protein VCRA2110O135_200048 [Vibrio crassostreae]|nr:hypothetical protein VCRA2110O135_200048 [Vibrio crassostreae]
MERITLKEAKEQRLMRYYTGELCINGHDAERKTSNRTCLECNKLKKRRK